MKKITPKISIGIPVYNGGDIIRETFDNLRNQTFKDFEVLISDDNSSDNTREVCLEYCKKDSRFRYVRQKVNLTWPGNLEYVFKNTTAPYFACISHDDHYNDKNFLQVLYKRIEKGYDLVYPDIIKTTRTKTNTIVELPRRNKSFDNTQTRFDRHLTIIRHSYIGYQIFGLMRRESVSDCFSLLTQNIYYKRSNKKNYLDEEAFLHFMFSRYNVYFDDRVSLVKDMTDSNYFRLNLFQSIVPMFWNIISTMGVIAQADYTNWQKFKLIFFKIARSTFVLFDVIMKDVQRKFMI